MNRKRLIQNIVMLVALLVTTFLSQNAAFRPVVQGTYNQVSQKVSPYTTRAGEWFGAIVYPRISGEVVKGGNTMQTAATKQKAYAVQTIWENFKNYFAEKFSNTFGTKVK